MKKTVKKFIISTCIALSANTANATAFNFTESINGTLVTGSFLGTVESGDANLINNISDFSWSVNGNTYTAYKLYGLYAGYMWDISTSPVMSFDEKNNNILASTLNTSQEFLNSSRMVRDYNGNLNFIQNQFVAWGNTTGVTESAGQVENYPFNRLENGYSVTPVISGEVTVPEPTSIALLAVGLLGFAASQRKKSFHNCGKPK